MTDREHRAQSSKFSIPYKVGDKRFVLGVSIGYDWPEVVTMVYRDGWEVHERAPLSEIQATIEKAHKQGGQVIGRSGVGRYMGWCLAVVALTIRVRAALLLARKKR